MRLVALLSGGIDSPVAAYVMSQVGADVLLLHMDNGPFSDGKEAAKVISIAEQLEKVTGREFPVYKADHGNSQESIKKNCDNAYQCVLCKRVMQHVAKEFAKRNGCSGIIMGDSLGQVASQTLRNIRAEGQGLDFPIVRPLIGMDKLEIISVAEKIGTYDISIIQTKGCSAVPIRPITEARPDKVMELQSKLDFAKIVSDSADSAVRIH
jgi:thiamine biosynthesis protein ThiI